MKWRRNCVPEASCSLFKAPITTGDKFSSRLHKDYNILCRSESFTTRFMYYEKLTNIFRTCPI